MPPVPLGTPGDRDDRATTMWYRPAFKHGLSQSVLGPGLGLIASMVGFGILAKDSGLPIEAAVALTVGVWCMTGQIAFVDLFTHDSSWLAVLLIVAIANLRILPITIATIPLLRYRLGIRPIQFGLAQILSATAYVCIANFCLRQPHIRSRFSFYIGFSSGCLVGGVLGTIVGYNLALELPTTGVQTLVLLTPLYLLLLTASSDRRDMQVAVVAGCITVPLFAAGLGDWGIAFAGVLAGTVGFAIGRIKPVL